MNATTFGELFGRAAELLRYDATAPLIFNSGLFLFLFVGFAGVYLLLRRATSLRILYVIAFSIYFYYKSSGIYFLLLLFAAVSDYLIGNAIAGTADKRRKRHLVALSVVVNLGMLGYFKYTNFFIDMANGLFGAGFLEFQNIFLPVGISFFVFQSMSYTIDIYRGQIRPLERWTDYLFYLSFFPQLVAGPIVRAKDFIPQIRKPLLVTREMFGTAIGFIIIGLVKKAIISDYISLNFVDRIFDEPALYSGFECLMGVYGYALQIYCDFSGYSDMAIGIALLLGFRFPKNFDAPYKSATITEFWRRWQISLSSWLRDYLYIPLGGNRKGKVRTYLNNFTTMLIGGLWHGASWKYVAWGGFHGVALILHKASMPLLSRIPDTRIVKFVSWFITLCFVIFTMTIFRINVLGDLWVMLHNVFTNFHLDYLPVFVDVRLTWCIFMLVLILSHAMPDGWWQRLGERFVRWPWIVKLAIFVVVVQLVLQFRSEDVAPFIYFQF